VELNRAGREYFYWPITGDPLEDPPDLSVGGSDYEPMVEDDEYEPETEIVGAVWYRSLLAGPDAETNPSGTVVVPRSGATVKIRVTASPEIIVRTGERIYLTR
jgi:hypothetical protein